MGGHGAEHLAVRDDPVVDRRVGGRRLAALARRRSKAVPGEKRLDGSGSTLEQTSNIIIAVKMKRKKKGNNRCG